jgi:hypothetical protein
MWKRGATTCVLLLDDRRVGRLQVIEEQSVVLEQRVETLGRAWQLAAWWRLLCAVPRTSAAA